MRAWTLALVLTMAACEEDGFQLVGTIDDPMLSDTGSMGPLPTSGLACSQVESQGLCTQFVGSSYSEQEVQSNCIGGTVRPDCPTMSRLGLCTLQEGGVFETRTYYYEGAFFGMSNIAGAESQCLLTGGVWN